MFRTPCAWIAATFFAFAFQDSLSSLKLTSQAFESNVANYVKREVSSSDTGTRLALPTIGSTARPLFLAMSDSARAAVVKELGLAAKGIVMSPAFDSAYTAFIKTEHNAVNHGLKVTDAVADLEKAAKSPNPNDMEAKMQAMLRQQFREMVLGMDRTIAQFDAAAIKDMAESWKGQMDSIPPMNAKEKAQHAEAAKLLNEAAKLGPSNLASAREKLKAGMLLGVYVDAGNAAGAQADDTKQKQQVNYNKVALKPTLKRKLLAFTAEAKTVDFKAATQAKGPRTVFVNPAYETKSPLWKLLYRLGPGGTTAAIAVAQSWAAEL